MCRDALPRDPAGGLDSTSGAAPLIPYTFRRVRRSTSTEDATCESPVLWTRPWQPDLSGRATLRHSGRARSAETPRDAFQTCDAGRAGAHLRSETVHRRCPSDMLPRIKRERVPTCAGNALRHATSGAAWHCQAKLEPSLTTRPPPAGSACCKAGHSARKKLIPI